MSTPKQEESSVLFLLDFEILPNPEISNQDMEFATLMFEKQYWIMLESGRLLPVNHKPSFPIRFFLIDSFDPKTKSSLLLAGHLDSNRVSDWSLRCECNYSSDIGHHCFEEDYIIEEGGYFYLKRIKAAWDDTKQSLPALLKELQITEDFY